MKTTINEDGKYEVLSSKYLIRRPWLTARVDSCKLPDGRPVPEYYVLEYPDWINVIAITDDGKMIMERQYRHGVGKTAYEIPCGVIEKAEEPLAAAKRELQTEDIQVFLMEQDDVKQLLEEGEILQILHAAPLWKYFSSHR